MNPNHKAAYTLLALSVCNSQVFANEDAKDSEALAPITITSQKIERLQQDTKESIAVVDAEDIADLPLFDFSDVFTITANAYDLGSGETFGIRGVTQNSQATGGGDGELGSLYIDGVAYTGFASRFGPKNLWDVERVEVLRGPQSTNVGRNALIGAVSINTIKPSLDGFDAAVRVGAGTYQHRSVETMLNLPISPISAFRLTTQYDENDGFIENVTRNEDDYDARRNKTIRGQFYTEPTDQLSLRIMLQYAETRRGQDIFRSDLQPVSSRNSSANLDAFENYDASVAAIDVNYDFNNGFSLRSITSYLDGDYERFDDDDEGPENGSAFRGRDVEDENLAEELRLSYVGERLRGVVGLYYTKVDLINNTSSRTNLAPGLIGVPTNLLPFYPTLIGVDFNAPFDQTTTNRAFFTEWDFDVQEQWTLSAGFRYDYEKQEIKESTNSTLAAGTTLPDPVVAGQQADLIQPGSGPAVEAGVTGVNAFLLSQLGSASLPRRSIDYEEFLPQVGATYRVNDNFSVSAFYKRGYRAGGSEVLFDGSFNSYDPETLDNYELSLRYRSSDNKLQLLTNIYYGDWKNQQVRVQQSSSQLDFKTENAGKSTIKGVEFELQYTPNSVTSLFFGLGIADTEFKKFVSNGVDLSGNEFANSPDMTVSVGGRRFLNDRFYIGGTLSYQDGTYANVDNNLDLDSRTLLNLKAGYEADQYSIEIYGRNLTDDLYRTINTTGLNNSSTTRVGAPREYGILLSARY